MGSHYLEIAFPVPLDKTFHYDAPNDDSVPESWVGKRVLAPFGKTKTSIGFVVGWTDQKPPFPTKPIVRFLDESPFITPPLLKLARWVADTYLCSLGEALAAVAPVALHEVKRQKGEERGEKRDTSLDGPSSLIPPPSSPHSLTTEQDRALVPITDAIDRKTFAPFLLHGITDSGKTEVYFHAIQRVLDAGKQVLYLLPEIALTPLFAERLKARFGSDIVALWHSTLSPGERWHTWTGVRDGRIRILLGARSAVFAPFPRLGLIVVDEEHEPSYKQEDRPRYHTREVALERARLENAVVVFGSATPSVETYWRATQGEFKLLELTSRVEARKLPPVELIDCRRRDAGQETEGEKKSPIPRRPSPVAVFSEPLRFAIEQRLARREQVMLFVNRRGYTPFMRCATCGWVARCPRCSTTLTLHLKGEEGRERREERKFDPSSPLSPRRSSRIAPIDTLLQCHACSHLEKAPIQCPSCKGMRLRNFGTGTQKVEQEIHQLYPFARLARMDRDSAGARRVHEKIYEEFSLGKVDILIGTQMIAKGFDFPGVTLVGVVDADVSLHLPDFRSAERTFQLVAQVAGRTGRGDAGGKVLVQTHHPDHYSLQAAKEHDFMKFYKEELPYRQMLRYPPFCRLVALLLRGTKEPAVREAAEELSRRLAELPQTGGVEVLGPVPSPYSRIRNQFRFQILLKGSPEGLAPYLAWLKGKKLKKAFLTVDVDPMDLL